PTGIDDPLPEGATPKLPMSAEFLPRARDYDSVFAFTAVYSPAQAVVACQIYRTRWLIPYVDRARRQLGDGLELVRGLRSVCDAHGGRTRILAASLKSPEQVVAAMQAGAQDVTLPLGVLEAMVHHEFTTQALADFAG
ncbi:MAG: transaldolase, partial [Myxococcota bacterium]